MELELHFTVEPLVPPPLRARGREIGACVEFLGLVRETEGEAKLEGLYYEAYELMAREQMERILRRLGERHACAAVEFVHRLGWVPVGEASIFLRVLAAHRGPALALCDAALELMKQDVPIWKRLAIPPAY